MSLAARGAGKASKPAAKEAGKQAAQCEHHKQEYRRLISARNRSDKQNDELRQHRDYIQRHCGGRFKRNAFGYGLGGYGGYFGRPYIPYGPYGYGMGGYGGGYGGYYGRPYGYGYGYGMRPWF